jgi:hypothetical protein
MHDDHLTFFIFGPCQDISPTQSTNFLLFFSEPFTLNSSPHLMAHRDIGGLFFGPLVAHISSEES